MEYLFLNVIFRSPFVGIVEGQTHPCVVPLGTSQFDFLGPIEF
jgi:hypothetical protein